MKYFLLTSITLAALCLSGPLFGQSADEQPLWYQIELIVFSRTEMTAESWPEEPGLKYSEPVVELKPAAASEVVLDEWLADIDNSLPVVQPSIEEDGANDDTNDGANDDNNDDIPPASISIVAPEPILIQLPQQPFTLLEVGQLQLTDMAERIARQSDFQQLFHGAWRQPIAARKMAESILIRGGKQYDDHYELEGSIRLGLERYLHIDTDLWLSTFAATAEQHNYFWAKLPKPPTPLNAELERQPNDSFSLENTFTDTSAQGRLQPSMPSYDNFFDDLTTTSYAVERTIALRQQRRMRSNELHYIDHPSLGVVIKITPYEFPALEAAEDDESTTPAVLIDTPAKDLNPR